MGADHRKRRLNSASDFDHGFQEHHRLKKKNYVYQQHHLNPHISLKLDGNGTRVVPKREQIGISWRHLDSFVASPPRKKSTLADVISVPSGVFDPNVLKEFVSYEAWQSLLSERERNYLKQFLPGEIKPEQVLKPLFAGENFHFGNPFKKWAASLCAGDLHPDAVLHQEQSVKDNKKAYYSELQKYHYNMIRNLRNMKERCANSSDPEAEILQKTRSRRAAGMDERRSYNPVENVGGTSESSSWFAEEKACSSENLNLSGGNGSELQKRIYGKAFGKNKNEMLAVSPEGLIAVSKTWKGEQLQKKLNPNFDDGSKYMSYVKISKKQHELVKSLKQSGNSIQAKALNHVLGDLDNILVKPYAMFEKEEKNRIFEYWSNLANKDLPAAFEKWQTRQTLRQQALKSLCLEMEEKPSKLNKVKFGDQDGNEIPGEISQDSRGVELVARQCITDESSESDASSMEGQSLQIPSLNGNPELTPVDLNSEDNHVAVETSDHDDTSDVGHGSQNMPEYPENQRPMETDENEHLNQSPALGLWRPASSRTSFSGAAEGQSSMESQSLQILSLNANPEITPMDLNAKENHAALETSNCDGTSNVGHGSRNIPEYPENQRLVEVDKNEHHHRSPALGQWRPASTCTSFSSSSSSIKYFPDGNLLIRQNLAVEEQPAGFIDLESEGPAEDPTRDFLHGQYTDLPFPNHQNRDGNGLLHSLFKRDGFPHEKNTELDFNTTPSTLEPGRFGGHFPEQLPQSFPFGQSQKVANEVFMHPNIQEPFPYAENSRFALPKPENFFPVGMGQWGDTRVAAPAHSHAGPADMLNHSWFPVENRVQSGWSGLDPNIFPTQGLGGGSGSDQGGLYSVLSQCSSLRSRTTPFLPAGSTILTMNHGEGMSGGIPRANGPPPQGILPFDQLSHGQEPAGASALKTNNLGWMLPRQTPSLHDPTEKPFLKSWHQ